MSDAAIVAAPADQADRDRILSDLDTTLLVEAGAGSGKTTSLVGRLLALIESGVRVVEIAAITFTNKAADEMKERFRLALERAYRDLSSDETVRARLSDAMGQLDQMFIGTIHSFCSSLLRERPIEAGLDPAYEEMDEEEDKAFRAMCWDDYMVELDGERRRRFDELQALGVDVNTLRSVYDRVSLFEDVELPCEECPRPDVDRIRTTLFPLLEEAFPYIPTTEPERGWDTVQQLVRQARQQLRWIDPSDDMRVLELAKAFDRKLDMTLNRWTSKEQAAALRDRFAAWQRDDLFPFLREWREHLYPKLIGFVRPALAYCRERRFARGSLNFQDLLMEAAKLLREHEDVRTYFAARYKRLLVDEFQDTDPIQAELMFLLTGESESGRFERDWRRLVPRPGSLFVVGDPKQSIYRFRRADISVYNEVKARIQSCGAVLRLTANFRSVKSIGDFVNGQFVGKLPPAETEHQAAFVTMETRAPNPKIGGRKAAHGIYVLSYPKLKGGKAAVAQADAERIARYIAWACRDGNLSIAERGGGSRAAAPGDFLILTKTKDFIHLYAEQLDRFGIPADTSGSRAAYEELTALKQLVRLLEDPEDAPALLSVLRGLLFGLSDQALWAYQREGYRLSLYPVPDAESCRPGTKPVAEALRRLRTYRKWVREMHASAAMARIVEDLGALPYASAAPAGSVRAGTLARLLQLLLDDPDAGASWTELRRKLEERLAGRGMETSSLYAGRSQAVRIMNLHKAKGLEAPVVFLACPGEESDHDATQYIDRSKAPAAGYFTISQRRGEHHAEVVAQPPGWDAMNETERRFANAEKDRLLYVAATRPKQMLVVSAYPEQPAKCPWTPLMDGMEFARELEVPEFDPEEREELGEGPDLRALSEERVRKLQAIAAPTYALQSVTELTKSAGDKPEWSAEGKGIAFGSVVHRAIERIGCGLPESELEAAVRMLAEEERLAAEHIGEAVRVVKNVLAGELWRRSLRARRRLFEVPFLLKKDGYVRGVIDFLFEEDDGWVIVDFKTDWIGEKPLQPFIDFYRPQVRSYAIEWERTLGYRVKETYLYFVQAGRCELVD